LASPCPPKERVPKKGEVKVLSFGEDLGEATKLVGRIKYSYIIKRLFIEISLFKSLFSGYIHTGN
jgi:hypothetical protein